MDNVQGLFEQLPSLTAPVSTIRTRISRQLNIDWQMLHLEQLGGAISGNKLFKLAPYLLAAKQQGYTRLLSFGGIHSNHLHALAGAGQRFGFHTIGVVRGYAEQHSPTLHDIQQYGMQVVFADKKTYAQRHDKAYQAALAQHYQALVIPEGGAGEAGIQGAAMMAQVMHNSLPHRPDIIAIAAGTGTSAAGLLRSAHLAASQLWVVLALKNAPAITALLSQQNASAWRVIDGYQCGGFAKLSPSLAEFIRQFEQQQSVLLEPLYTAKLCWAIEQMMLTGQVQANSRIVSIHTGGLQGRRSLQAKIQHLTQGSLYV